MILSTRPFFGLNFFPFISSNNTIVCTIFSPFFSPFFVHIILECMNEFNQFRKLWKKNFCLFSYLKSFPLCSFGKVNKLSSCVGICLNFYICLDSYFSRFWKEILKAVKCSFTPVSFVHWHFKCITSPTTYVEVSRIWCIWETWSTVVGYPKVLLTFWVMHVKMSWIYGTFPTRAHEV